jgi:hypothetical protein
VTLPFSDNTDASTNDPLRLIPALLVLIAIKLAVLIADPAPRFFLWDSVTYLQGAIGGPLPRDRSFLYSFVIAATAVPAHSLLALVIAQTLAGVVGALLLYLMLRVFFSVRFGLALAAAMALALGPSQLFYERMVMAEAIGGMLWFGFIALALAYLRDGRARWLPLLALCGICAVAFRLNATIVVVLVSAALPLLRRWFTPRSLRVEDSADGRRRLALHLGIALACTLVCHVGYRHIVARVAHTEPGYIGTEGLFTLGYVAPAVEEKDFRGTGCQPDLLTRIDRPLADARTREYQLWGASGLWAQMQRYCPNPEAAADTVAQRAFRRIGPYVLPMAFATVARYFDNDDATWRMNSDLGRKGMLPLELIQSAKKYFDLDVKPIAFTNTLTSVWFEHSRWWLTGCFLLSPLFAVWLTWRTRDGTAAAARLLALVVVGLFLIQFLLSPVIVFRYLHPFPPLVIACLAAMFGRVQSRPQPARADRDIVGPVVARDAAGSAPVA